MNKNSENPKVGREFEMLTKKWAENQFGCSFIIGQAVDIGIPPKPHKFDLVSKDEGIVVECKCYTWTEGGNVPSAKLATLDEAILYMRSISRPAHKIIVMQYAWNEKKGVSLAEYFCEKKGHLLDDISVWELKDWNNVKLIRKGM